MSMPTFPENGLDITKEKAFYMLLGSIAMEELALSHIMNAEGEKLQYILGTLPSSHNNICPTTKDLLDINKSISTLLERVSENQILLKGKLSQVLCAMETHLPCTPCPPPCPSQASLKSCVLTSPHGFCFRNSTHLPLKPSYCPNKCSSWWHKENPCNIYLPPNKSVLLSYTFQFSLCEDFPIIALERLKAGAWENLLELPCVSNSLTNVISGSIVLVPDICQNTAYPIAITLCKPTSILLKSASLSIIEL